MAITPPNKIWKKLPIGKDERIWSFLIIIMVLMMGIMTVGYVFVGNQNPPEEYHRYPTEAIPETFSQGNIDSGAQITTLSNGELGLEKPGGGDIYLYAQQWAWVAQLGPNITSGVKLEEGQTYRLHIGSKDILHGFQLIGSDFLITLQIVPGYDYVVEFIPNETGLFRIICNEYCGTAHHTMLGFMEIV